MKITNKKEINKKNNEIKQIKIGFKLKPIFLCSLM